MATIGITSVDAAVPPIEKDVYWCNHFRTVRPNHMSLWLPRMKMLQHSYSYSHSYLQTPTWMKAQVDWTKVPEQMSCLTEDPTGQYRSWDQVTQSRSLWSNLTHFPVWFEPTPVPLYWWRNWLARRFFYFWECCVVIGEYHTESIGVPEFFDPHLSILNGLADGITLLIFEWKYLEANLHPSDSFQPQLTPTLLSSDRKSQRLQFAVPVEVKHGCTKGWSLRQYVDFHLLIGINLRISHWIENTSSADRHYRIIQN